MQKKYNYKKYKNIKMKLMINIIRLQKILINNNNK